MMCGIRDVVPAVPSDSCHIFAGDLLGKDKAGVFCGGACGAYSKAFVAF